MKLSTMSRLRSQEDLRRSDEAAGQLARVSGKRDPGPGGKSEQLYGAIITRLLQGSIFFITCH
jgi:hypothetical protein